MTVIVQDAFSQHIPADEVFLAGAGVVGSPWRNISAYLRFAHENITGGKAPGAAALTLNGSSEAKTPHDHSGTIGTGSAAVAHGKYRSGLNYTGLGFRWGSIYHATPASQNPVITSLASSGWLASASQQVTALVDPFATSQEIDLAKWTTTDTTTAVLVSIVPIFATRGANTINALAWVGCNNAAATNTPWTTAPHLFCAIYSNASTPALLASQELEIVQNGYLPPASGAKCSQTWIAPTTFAVTLPSQLTANTVLYAVFGIIPQAAESATNMVILNRGVLITDSQV